MLKMQSIITSVRDEMIEAQLAADQCARDAITHVPA